MDAPAQVSLFVQLKFLEVYWFSVRTTARQFKKFLWVCGIVAAIMFGAHILAATHPSPNTDWQRALDQGRPAFWFFALLLAFVFALPLLTARKTLENQWVRDGIDYAFSDQSVKVKTSLSESEIQWPAFTRAVEVQSAFWLGTSTLSSFILPKRCFGSHEEIVALRSLVATHVRGAKLLPSD
jgi:hypothetical protein